MTTPATPSLTGGETPSLTKSHHPAPPLTCEVSPVSPSLKPQFHPSLISLTTLRGETVRPRLRPEPPTPHGQPAQRHSSRSATPPMDGAGEVHAHG